MRMKAATTILAGGRVGGVHPRRMGRRTGSNVVSVRVSERSRVFV
jgi:hypothetical protein